MQGNHEAGPPDVRSWARELVDSLPEDVWPQESTILRSQAEALDDPERIATPPDEDPSRSMIVRCMETLHALTKSLADRDAVAIDLETTSLKPQEGEIVGLGLAVEDATYYIPFRHRDERTEELLPDQLPLATVAATLGLGELPLIAHNAKFELKWLRRHTGIEPTFTWDTMLAARLLRSDQPADLKKVVQRELDVPDWGLAQEDIQRVECLPLHRAAGYCAKDCYYCLALYRRQVQCLG